MSTLKTPGAIKRPILPAMKYIGGTAKLMTVYTRQDGTHYVMSPGGFRLTVAVEPRSGFDSKGRRFYRVQE